MVVTNTQHRLRRSVYASQIMLLMLLLALVPPWLGGTPTQAAMLPPQISNAAPTGVSDACLNESFDDVSILTNTGWSIQNLSEPVGVNSWYQGSFTTFTGQREGYIAANYNNTSGVGTISNWLISPAIELSNDKVISFWTRTPASNPEYPDRLELRLSTAGTSTNVGSTSNSVGDFTTLLLSINPDLTTGVYPRSWTRYSVAVSGLSAPTTGRLAFRYFVTNGGSSGSNSNYVGIDEFTYGFCPEISVANATLLGNATQFYSTDFGDSASYSWDFGDGSTGSGVALQHTYASSGSYPVTLTTTLSGTTFIDTATAFVIPSAPGGVAEDLALWLKADAGITQAISGSPVSSWADQAGLGHDVAQSTSDHWPTYQTNAWNGNPVLNFDTSDYFTRTITGSELFGSSQASILFAKRSISGGVWFKWETASNNRVGFEISNSSTRFDIPNDSTGRLLGTTSIVDRPHLVVGVKSATNQQLYFDGTAGTSRTQSGLLNTSASSTLALGKQPNGTLNWNGAMGEVIVYKRALSTTERNQVESYLALKYGLPLGSPTTPISYTDSQGSTIWAGNSTYQNNVTGIGRDDSSELDQRRSTSTLDGDILTVAHGTLTNTTALPSDRSFLIWGHDGISSTATITGVSFFGTAFTRLERTWRIQSSGTLAPVTIAFDLSDLAPGSYDPTSLALMIDADENISDGQMITDGKIIDGQSVSFQVDEVPSEAFISLMIAGSSTLTVATDGNGSVTSASGGINCGSICSATYVSTSTVVLTATPALNHNFSGWSGACSGTSLTCTLNMQQSHTVTATFAIDRYALTLDKPGNGSGTVASLPEIDCGTLCSAMFDYSTVVTLTATPNTGSSFAGWSGACAGTQSTCTVTMDQTQNISATFTLNRYDLTVTKFGSGSGTVTSLPEIDCGTLCSAMIDYGTVVTLTATPETGSSFDSWSGACSGTQTTCSITIDQAKSVTAIFTINRYALTVTKSGTSSGVVTSPPGIDCGTLCTATFSYGTVVTLTATPETGSFFGGWSGACTGTATTCEITIDQAKTVNASFITNALLDVTLEGSGSGTIVSDPAGIDCGTMCSATFEPGTVVTLTATLDANSIFTGWSGACSGTSLTCTVTMDESKNIVAMFELSSHTLSVTKSGTGSGTITSLPQIDCGTLCIATFNHGSVVTLTATPESGSFFGGWSGACSGTSLTCTVTMDQAQSVDASFIPDVLLEITRAGTGSGTITSDPAGIDCGTTCSATFEPGTVVTLTATPDTGSVFTGWSGACTGTASTCQITMDQASSVTATFTSSASAYSIFLPVLRR